MGPGKKSTVLYVIGIAASICAYIRASSVWQVGGVTLLSGMHFTAGIGPEGVVLGQTMGSGIHWA